MCDINMSTGFGILSILLLAYASTVQATGNIYIDSIGNSLHATSSGVDAPNATFLLSDAVLTNGTLFAYAGFFRALTPVHFQVWRLVVNQADAGSTFQLVSDTRVIPSVYGEEVIYLAAKQVDCFKVKAGDRLGISQEGVTGAFSYAFDATEPRALVSLALNNRPLTIGDVVEFDTLVFPYEISAQAYIHTDESRYPDSTSEDGAMPCLSDLLIPDHETTPDDIVVPDPVLSIIQGATGPTGPQGEAGLVGAAGPQGVRGTDGAAGSDGADGEYGQQGGLGVTGLRGPTGADGIDGLLGGVGSTGPNGPRGEQGQRGLQGPAGETVLITGDGATNQLFKAEDDTSFIGLSDSLLSIIMFVWLCLVTLLLVITIIVFACVSRRQP